MCKDIKNREFTRLCQYLIFNYSLKTRSFRPFSSAFCCVNEVSCFMIDTPELLKVNPDIHVLTKKALSIRAVARGSFLLSVFLKSNATNCLVIGGDIERNIAQLLILLSIIIRRFSSVKIIRTR